MSKNKWWCCGSLALKVLWPSSCTCASIRTFPQVNTLFFLNAIEDYHWHALHLYEHERNLGNVKLCFINLGWPWKWYLLKGIACGNVRRKFSGFICRYVKHKDRRKSSRSNRKEEGHYYITQWCYNTTVEGGTEKGRDRTINIYHHFMLLILLAYCILSGKCMKPFWV